MCSPPLFSTVWIHDINQQDIAYDKVLAVEPSNGIDPFSHIIEEKLIVSKDWWEIPATELGRE